MGFQVGRDTVMDLRDRVGIDEGGRANLDGGAARDQELERVLGAHDAADPDHRDAHRSRGLMREVDCQWTYGRPGQASCAEAEPRPARVEVDRHAHERVDRA